MNKLEAELPLR